MRTRSVLVVSALSSVVSIVLTLGVCWVWLQVRNEAHWEIRGGDPIIVVDQSRVHPSGAFVGEVRGVVTFDRETGCLLLDLPDDVAIDGPGGERIAHPIRAAVVWPKWSRPIRANQGRGVAVGAFLGRIGGEPIFEGDQVQGPGQYAVALSHTELLVPECATDSGVIAIFTDPEVLPVTR